jgi:hypothetical protein
MLLDELMPQFDVVERHGVLVHAEAHAIYAAIHRVDLASGAITRLLLTLRTVPAGVLAMLRSPTAARAEWRARRARSGARLADFERAGFRIVAESPPNELVLGLLGQFWTPRGARVHGFDAGVFRIGPPSGYALAAWNFTIEAQGAARCVLRTETRVQCAPDVRAKFLLYWLFVRPGSGLIRRSMLRAIRREAET